ncbi:sulfotransferase [Bradyrhizobium sp. Leaf401]|uniref:sulfotransferase family protein n=1 Tax=Bradyrhizobium sp. Leaf401 TaxID=2876564 RepID=UPI001E5F60BA|nr:sulfotransferase [Bradyrhizobium sp. Leaf401]
MGRGVQKPHQLKLGLRTWWRLRRDWELPFSPSYLRRMVLGGAAFTGLRELQSVLTPGRQTTSLRNSIFIVGHWRSGTTFLHELLSLDDRYGFPPTYACLFPHCHFFLKRAMLRSSLELKRPMDDMPITPLSPQEDEFALLCLGARSPYEALLVPHRLRQALRLSDVDALTAGEAVQWDKTFVDFLSGVSLSNRRRPLILKSPPHSYRVSRINRLVPDARFILIVRDPYAVFESTVRMWSRLLANYTLGPRLSDEEIRSCVLDERLHFEAKLQAGIAELPADRIAIIRYEALVRDPKAELAKLYAHLKLSDFERVLPALRNYQDQRSGYAPSAASPSPVWREKIADTWGSIFDLYEYSR